MMDFYCLHPVLEVELQAMLDSAGLLPTQYTWQPARRPGYRRLRIHWLSEAHYADVKARITLASPATIPLPGSTSDGVQAAAGMCAAMRCAP